MKSCVSVILALALVFIIFEVVTMNPHGSGSSSSSQDSDPGFEKWMESKDKNCKDVAGGFYSSPC